MSRYAYVFFGFAIVFTVAIAFVWAPAALASAAFFFLSGTALHTEGAFTKTPRDCTCAFHDKRPPVSNTTG